MPLKMLGDRTLRFLAEHASNLFDQVNVVFFELADDLDDNDCQTHYFDAIKLLRAEKADITSRWLAAVSAAFDELALGSVSGEQHYDVNSESLSLLGNDDLEEVIAFDRMVSAATTSNHSELNLLQRRISKISKCNVGLRQLPLSPEFIAERFANALRSCDLALQPKLSLLDLFESSILHHMPGLLDQCNQLLEGLGVLPGIKPEPINGAVTKASPSKIRDKSGHTTHGREDCDVPEQEEIIPAIVRKSLLTESPDSTGLNGSTGINGPTGTNGKPHRRRKSASPLLSRLQPLLVNKTGTNIAADSVGVGAASNQCNKLSCEELIIILENRKHANDVQGDHLDAEHAPPNGGGVMHQIEHLLAEQSEQFSDLDELDQTVITLVDQLFNQANERKWVPDKLASLFSRIELPTAQLALADQSFFDLDQHPIRRLLNEVASVANSLQAVENLHKDPLGKKLNEVIARLEQQETDIAQLNDLLSDFIKFVETDRQRTSVMEKRVMEEEVAAEKINSARADVEETLGSRLLGVEYGYCLVEFVEKAWSRVMFRASLKYGIGSEPWTQVVHLLDQLLGLESMEEVEAEFLGHLLDVIGESLSDISYDPYEVGRMFANIRRYFLEEKNKYENVHPIILDKSEAQLTGDYSLRVRVESVDVEIPGESVIPDKELVGSVDDNLLTQIESLKKGVWVELGDDDAAPAQRCRLLGIVEPSGKYVFGDRNGRKAAVASRYRLAVKMKEGKLIVLDNSHLFDEALADVIRDATQKSRTKNTAV